MPSPSEPPRPSWVILGAIPRVSAAAAADNPSIDLAAPPRVSLLTIPEHIFMDKGRAKGPTSPSAGSPTSPATSSSTPTPTPRQLKRRRTSSVIRHPRILSADLFLTVTPTPHPTASSSSAATDVCCFVLDAASCTSHRVPDPDPAPGFARFGVIAAPDGASFMVVGLRCPIGNDRASLHCFLSRTGGWVTKDVNNPRPHRAWTLSDVIAHDGKLWWVDTSSSTTKGLLYCDPFADQPSMSFVPFPNHVTAVEARAKATAYDYVQVADGTLRWVLVLCDLDETADDDGYRLELEVLPHWRGDFSLCFIWESDSFKTTEMPKDEQPVVALIDPNDTDLLYFFFGDYLFGFDIRGKAPKNTNGGAH
ncbi:unnamed protein product [Miscanthus lutarioriparius]|uniref:DUF1618 domain-containing protein n=1 Tax=Miscanthus lutarioriparius TaxID=422564 RepID=A0A811P467_9POAL|nr:unnamed protein product [Miscanthus lutarioriparius]